jgi:hypothetical protein
MTHTHDGSRPQHIAVWFPNEVHAVLADAGKVDTVEGAPFSGAFCPV